MCPLLNLLINNSAALRSTDCNKRNFLRESTHFLIMVKQRGNEPLICSSNEQVFTGESISFFTGTSFLDAKAIGNRFLPRRDNKSSPLNE